MGELYSIITRKCYKCNERMDERSYGGKCTYCKHHFCRSCINRNDVLGGGTLFCNSCGSKYVKSICVNGLNKLAKWIDDL